MSAFLCFWAGKWSNVKNGKRIISAEVFLRPVQVTFWTISYIQTDINWAPWAKAEKKKNRTTSALTDSRKMLMRSCTVYHVYSYLARELWLIKDLTQWPTRRMITSFTSDNTVNSLLRWKSMLRLCGKHFAFTTLEWNHPEASDPNTPPPTHSGSGLLGVF